MQKVKSFKTARNYRARARAKIDDLEQFECR